MPKIGIPAAVSERAAKIREFFNESGAEYLWVPVSGGKDSVAVWGLTVAAGVPYVAVYIQIPGQTVADNIRAVERVAKSLGVRDAAVVVVRETRRIRDELGNALSTCSLPCLLRVIPFTPRGEDFWGAMLRYGFPAPLGRFGKGTRWCCGTFKHRVLNRLPYNGERNGEPWKYGVDGTKATDSPYRARVYQRDIMTWEATRDTYYLPIRTATNAEVWAMLETMGLVSAVKPQYDRWGRAPNCFFCPMLGKAAIHRAAEAMTPQQRTHVAKHLKAILPKYRDGTYSRKAMEAWLEVLE